ncbi:Fimbrial protein [Nymphon striatum]|nr:Fimbrial protein [Nymphon striatum]
MMYGKTRNQFGFTLMELMITVSIIGIIATIAVPSYSEYVIKAKRADAKGNLGFGGASVQSENDLYTISIVEVLDTANGPCDGTNADACSSYVIEASPIAGSSQARDIKCTSFRIDNVGRKFAIGGTVTSYPATPTVDSLAKTKECWGK